MAFLYRCFLLALLVVARCQDEPACPADMECRNQPLRCLDGSPLAVKDCCNWFCASGSEVCYTWVDRPEEICEDGSEPQRESCESFSCDGIAVGAGPALAAGRIYTPEAEMVVRSNVNDVKHFHGKSLWQTYPTSTTRGNLSAELLHAFRSTTKLEGELLLIHGTADVDVDFKIVVAEGDLNTDAERWLRQARDEHASVAAFALLQLEMLAHGASHDLLSRVLIASQEELAHVNACEALANSSVQLTLPPHELKVQLHKNWTQLLQRSLYDGVVLEGRAALQLWQEAHAEILAGRPQRGRLLWAMGQDEARHAELAHDTALWAAAEQGIDVPPLKVYADRVVVNQDIFKLQV